MPQAGDRVTFPFLFRIFSLTVPSDIGLEALSDSIPQRGVVPQGSILLFALAINDLMVPDHHPRDLVSPQ